jgi:hypothetical protein
MALRRFSVPLSRTGLLKRKSRKLAAVALANRTARIAWKMMLTGETYIVKSAAAVSAGAVQRSVRHGKQLNCNRADGVGRRRLVSPCGRQVWGDAPDLLRPNRIACPVHLGPHPRSAVFPLPFPTRDPRCDGHNSAGLRFFSRRTVQVSSASIAP